MPIYTVHEPPLRATDPFPDPQRYVFVRDGFSIWAFLVAALWMLRHGMWLVLLIYLVVSVGVEAALRVAGVPSGILAIVGLCISLLVGIEASTLRRFTLARRGWRNVAVVSGHDLEDAERRFFGSWVGTTSAAEEAAPQHAQPGAVRPRPDAPDVIGLFPEPGMPR
jgi:hypothetical protein